MSAAVGPRPRRRTRRQKVRSELRLLRRDGLVGYLHGRYLLNRFHRSLKNL